MSAVAMLAAAFGFLPTDSFNVVVLIAVFVLISLGLHFTFGLLNVVNLMHGEFLLLGAYTAFEVQQRTGSSLVGMLVAPIVGAIVGVAVERGILRVLYERPLDSLLATFGLSVIIRQVIQLLYTANPRSLDDPIGGSFLVAGLNVPFWRLVVVLVTIALVAGVRWMLQGTPFGLRARATVRNPVLAAAMGIKVGPTRATLFAIGAGLTAFAGAVLAPLNTLDPQYGLLFLVNAFLVVILGGQGSLRGLVVAAIVLGGSLSIMQFAISSVIAQILVIVIAVVAVRLRPVLLRALAERRERRATEAAKAAA